MSGAAPDDGVGEGRSPLVAICPVSYSQKAVQAVSSACSLVSRFGHRRWVGAARAGGEVAGQRRVDPVNDSR
jgi:hypothetical protein